MKLIEVNRFATGPWRYSGTYSSWLMDRAPGKIERWDFDDTVHEQYVVVTVESAREDYGVNVPCA